MKLHIFFLLILFTPNLATFKHFVLISAPGSGKGTFSQHMVKKYNYAHICPGDILRDEIRRQTDLGKKIQPIVENGDYVDRNVVWKLISDKLKQVLENGKPFLLDGFPREEDSFKFLHDFLQQHNLKEKVCFVQLTIDDEICIERILNRLVCTTCFMVYNTKSAQSNQQNICGNCESSLSKRTADTKEIAIKRLQFFHKRIEPLIELAKDFYTVEKINAHDSLLNLEKAYETLIV